MVQHHGTSAAQQPSHVVNIGEIYATCPDWIAVSGALLTRIRQYEPAALAQSYQTGHDLGSGMWWLKLSVLTAHPNLVVMVCDE